MTREERYEYFAAKYRIGTSIIQREVICTIQCIDEAKSEGKGYYTYCYADKQYSYFLKEWFEREGYTVVVLEELSNPPYIYITWDGEDVITAEKAQKITISACEHDETIKEIDRKIKVAAQKMETHLSYELCGEKAEKANTIRIYYESHRGFKCKVVTRASARINTYLEISW